MRFVITTWGMTDGKPWAKGHYIGPGRRSVLTLHRNLLVNQARNFLRSMRGRYVWP